MKNTLILITLIAVSILIFAGAVMFGSSGLGVSNDIIVLNIRLPRALFAFFAGGALGISGACLQGIFKNPMADSYILGVSSGASLGAALSIAFGSSLFFLGITPLFATIGALLSVVLVYSMSRFSGKLNSYSLILSGVAINALMSAFVYFIMILNRDKMESIVLWTMGSLAAVSWEKLIIASPIILICSAITLFYARDLNIMLQGDEEARHLGVDVDRVRKILLLLTTVAVAAVVSFCGVIGFVGLIVPHVLRLISGPNHKTLLIHSFIGGGAFLLLCDTIARSTLPMQEIPVGVVSAIFGAPYFLYLLRRGKRRGVL